MGTSKVEIYLASPKTAAACAVAGKNCDAGSVNELNSRKGKQTT